ncbi:MAG: acetyl-CoA C-acyltransferase [Pseudomonadota bacterium]
MSDTVAILAARRTPMGGFQGELSGALAPALGAAAIRAALQDSGVDADRVQEVLMGCVLPAGQGQAPARQAALGAGLGEAVPASTLNKMCGSGMKTVMMAADALMAGHAGPGAAMVAGGMESMSNAPYLLPKMRAGARLGHAQAIDHMFLDGLEDAYDRGRLMGTFAEDCAEHYQFTREAQDNFAIASLEQALAAQNEGRFDAEVVPVEIAERKARISVGTDEQPRNARPDKIPHLKPAFREGGTVTPANSSSISDGAAALVLMRAREAEAAGRPVRARIMGQAAHAQAPGWFTTAPVPAMQKLLMRLGWSVEDVDLWEINEAFAVVPMAAMREMGIPLGKLNVNGGACALGHPIGASGARILVTLLHALEARGLKRGIAGICIGGGEATAIAIERP